MLKKLLSVLLVFSLTVALIVVSPNSQPTYSAADTCTVGCGDNVVSPAQLQLLLAAENNDLLRALFASPAFQAIKARVVPNTHFSVVALPEGLAAISFEVMPKLPDPQALVLHHELATFMLRENEVLLATTISRDPSDNHAYYLHDLLLNSTVRVATEQALPALPEVAIQAPVPDHLAAVPQEQLCFNCHRWETRGGFYAPDNMLVGICQRACEAALIAAIAALKLKGLAPAAAWAAALAAYEACYEPCRWLTRWVPSYTVCVGGEWSVNCIVRTQDVYQ